MMEAARHGSPPCSQTFTAWSSSPWRTRSKSTSSKGAWYVWSSPASPGPCGSRRVKSGSYEIAEVDAAPEFSFCAFARRIVEGRYPLLVSMGGAEVKSGRVWR
jgi:hypothetical protein